MLGGFYTSTGSTILAKKTQPCLVVGDIAALSLVSHKMLQSIENASPALFQVAVCNSCSSATLSNRYGCKWLLVITISVSFLQK